LPAEAAAGRALLGPHREICGAFIGPVLRVFAVRTSSVAIVLLDLAAISVYNSGIMIVHFFWSTMSMLSWTKKDKSLLEYLEGAPQHSLHLKEKPSRRFLSKANVHEIVEGEAVADGVENRSTFSAAHGLKLAFRAAVRMHSLLG